MWISTSKTAKLLHVSTETLRRMAADGRLDGVRRDETPGGHARYWEEDVKALVAGTLQRTAVQPDLPPTPSVDGAPASVPERGRPWKLITFAVVVVWLVGSYAATWVMWDNYSERYNDMTNESITVHGDWLIALSEQLDDSQYTDSCIRYMTEVMGIGHWIQGDLARYGMSPKLQPGLKRPAKAYIRGLTRTAPPFPPDNLWTRALDSPWGVLAWPAREVHHERMPRYEKVLRRVVVTHWQQEVKWVEANPDACAPNRRAQTVA